MSRLIIDAADWAHAPKQGESIAVNGCCLTVVDIGNHNVITFDVIAQTLSLTTLGALAAGDPVNLEHAASPSTLLGGHIVQGHIDGVATVVESANHDDDRLRFRPPLSLMPFIIAQGSVAVDGVSLTVAARSEHDAADSSCWFEVALIPETKRATTLGRRKPGDRVNIETDYLARIVLSHVMRQT